MQLLLDHAWPGNVRELDHAVERAVLMAQDELVRARDLGLRAPKDAVARIEDMSLEEVEGFPDQEGAGPLRRQRQPGRQGARPQPQRVVSTAAAIRTLTASVVEGFSPR